VEVEVPQTCSFTLRTTECTLSEVKLINPQGQLVYSQAPSAVAFKAAMERNMLKFTIEGESSVSLFPEMDEPTNILNIKRGIISALMAPAEEEQSNRYMHTLHGVCQSEVTVNSKGEPATDVTVTRDLQDCDHFDPQRDYTSPLALISGMNMPLSTLISSSQSCNYQFDPKRRHVTEATCIEKHIFLPFSHNAEYGISSLVKQTLTLQESSKINNRYFDHDESTLKSLFMEHAQDKSPVQTKEAVLTALRDLVNLPKTQQGQQRAGLFQKLVTELRALRNETLGLMIEEMNTLSSIITSQALVQCGTPECTSAILQVLRTSKSPAFQTDLVVYALGLLPSPCNRRVRDLLSMAQNKQTRGTFYALSNSVKKFYQNEGKVTPEITDVADFMAFMLGSDCSGDQDSAYLTLRAIGNMGGAMEAASPKLKSTMLKCVRQQATSLAVQQAAIQAFRQMTITDEVRSILLQTFQDGSAPVQKRVAAYLMLMKNPTLFELGKVSRALVKEKNEQVKSFVASHIANILDSKDASVQQLKDMILEALKGNEVPAAQDFKTFSRNYQMSSSMPSQGDPLSTTMKGNMIFDPSGYMPREVMLETTLKAFGYNIDMFEVGLDGKGFEPSIDSLFGEKGFFPDSAMKVMYWAENKMPDKINDILKQFTPLKNERAKRELPEDIMKELSRNFNKLVKDLKSQTSPEAVAYLRILGMELGYLKTSDVKYIGEMAMALSSSLAAIPGKIAKSLLSSTDNEIFAHYIFMDNEFSLPTSTGFPLKFSLSGIFAPGATGGLERPSMGIEFVTHMGVHIPEFTTAGIEMHTTVYHESGLKATLTMKNNQVKLSIPAPQGPTQLFSVSNKLLSVSSTQTEIVPPMVESRTDSVTCKPLITGLQFCSIVRYSNASSTDAAPYYPLTGETRFALEIQPTGEVTEYSATIGYELVKEGRHKVDTVKIALNTEGTEGTEATATLKYNRNRNAVSSDFKIPDYDVEAGVKLGATADGMYKGKKTYILSLDVTNKNIPELTLVGRARLEGMKDGLLQVQMTVPSLKIDASTTATIKSSSGLTVQLDSSVKIPESSSLQRVIFRYDDDKAEIELKSDVNSELTKLLPSRESYQKYLQRYIDDILDQKVAKTDMKLRHIVSKSIEASNIWLDKVAKDFPYVETFRSKRNIPELTLPSLPERLYLKSDSLFRYQFNKDKFIINIPLPFGGQSSEDLNIPNVMYTPPLYLPKMNINIPTKELTIPSFTIPPTYELSLPLLGVAELSTRLSSNYYNWTASVSGGNQTQDVFNYAAQYQVTAEGPVDFLSYKIEGTGLLTGLFEDTWKGIVNGSLHHQLLDASFSYSESGTRKEKINARANSNFDASSVLGLKATMFYSSHLIGTSDLLTTDSSLEGRISLGQLYSTCSYTTTYEIDLVKLQGKGESTLNLDSSLFQATNRLKGSYSNEELSITSSTDALNHALKHIGEVNYKNGQFSLKSDTTARSPYKTLTNKVELLLSSQAATVRAESQVQYLQNKVSAVVSGSLNDRGLEINTDGSINMEVSCGFHKGTLSINREGLLTSSTTNFKCTPVKFENVFNGGIDASGAAFKLNNMMGSYKKMKTDNTHKLTITLWTLSFQSKTDNYICPQASYKHDVKLDMKPFIASLSLNNDLRLLDADVTNEGQFKLEPYKMNLMGNIRGTYGPKKEVRHNYEISYSDLKGIVKCSTTGNIEGAQMSHNFDLEVAGLSAKFNSEGRINSKSLKADSKILTLAMPFSLSVDAIINADGKLNLYENHNGQLYSKFLLKAEPLALTYSHDCRASTAHGTSVSTLLENKVDALLVPSEQKGTWKLKTKFNKNVYNHDILAFNSAEQIGVELSGQLLTDLFNKLSSPARSSRDVSSQVQDFTISGFLKYDKNKDIHVIHLPFVESLPALIEQTKYAFVTALESLQEYLKSLNINDVIRKYKASLDKLPQQVNDYIKKMDLENKVSEAKKKLIAFTEEYTVTLEDLEAVLEQLQETAVNTISAMEDIIKKYDLKKIKESGAAWLQNLDAKYEIKAELQRKLNELKKLIQSLDLQKIADDLKEQIQAINLEESLSKLKVNIPTEEITKILDAIKDVLLNWIEEYEVTEKINVAYLKLKELIVKYEVDKKLQVLMDKAVQLSKQYKVKETVQSAVNALKRIDVKTYTDKAQKYLDDTIKQLKAVDYKKLIDHLNECIDWLLKELKSFDYNTFVDDANKRISEMTKYVNDQIKTLEIPQKIEALREYVREIQNAAVAYLEKLKDTKVAEVIAWIRDFVDTTALNEIGKVVEDNLMDLKQRISTMDIRREIQIYLQRASDFYINMVNYITEQWNKAYQEISNLAEKYDRIRTANILRVTIEQGFVFPEIRIATLRIPSFELSLRALKKAEFETPEFTVPFTDLFIPSTKINLKKLQDISIPARFTTPAVKILNTYTIPSITIDFNEIRKGIISVVDRVRDFKIQLPEPKIYFRDLKVAYLSDLPDFTLPEITLSEISIPEFSIPKLDLTNFQITMLQIPEFQLPRIPHEVSVPTFGKLYGEFKIKSPYYNLITSAEIQNATTTQETPTFTASVTSQATSTLECLAYTLDATAQISAPKMRSLVLAETIKVNHIAFSLDHESSLSFLGAEVLGTARTTAKATTEVYTADLVNTIRVSLQSGVSATMSTTYNHNLNIPAADISCQAALLQNINTRLESGTVSVTIGNTGNGKWSIQEYVDEGRHKSDLEFNININTAKLTFAGETSSKVLKMKQSAKVEAVIFSHVTLDMSAQTETPFLRTSVLEVKGKAHLADMKIELIANHDAELTGRISGTLTHSLNFLVHPFEVVFNTNNKGNMKIAFPLKLTGKIDLLNKFNQYKYIHNFTLGNNEKDIGVYAAMNGEANLDFLNVPITIPAMQMPYTSVKTPSVKDLSLWERTGLKSLLGTTRQSFDLSFKNTINIPALGNLTYDFAFKSTVITLNANAGLYNQADIVARFGASSTSVFEVLKFKLDGTTSLTRKRGLKLATALSLDHVNVGGSHDSTVSLTKKNMEASVSTNAKVNLPIVSVDFSQELLGNSKSKPNVASKIKLEYNFDVPQIPTKGKGSVEQNLALEGLTSYFSLEASTKGKIDGTMMQTHKFTGTINNEANVYLNANGLRSTMKTDANSKVDTKKTKVWNFEMNENVALEASPRRIYAMWNYTSNNEAIAKSFNTKGKQVAKATLDLVPSMLLADFQIDISQPSSFAEEASIFETLTLSVNSDKQKFTWSVESPVYNVSWTTSLENKSPSFISSVKSSCSSTMMFLEYDLEASTTTTYQDGDFDLNGKCTISHKDFSLNEQHQYTLHGHRMKRQSTPDAGASRQSLIVDITSPTFVDVSVRYVAVKDSITASLSSPSAGFLGFLLERDAPEGVHTSLYCRYPSSPDKDVNILDAKMNLKNPQNLHIEGDWDAQVSYDMLAGLKQRAPRIMCTVYQCINKYHREHFGMDINRATRKMKNAISDTIETSYRDFPLKISQLQSETKDIIRQYQKKIKDLLDAAIKFLRETKFQLPGYEERFTGHQIYMKATQSVMMYIDQIMQKVDQYLEECTDALLDYIKKLEFKVPGTDQTVSGKKLLDDLKIVLRKVQDKVREIVKSLQKISLEKMLQEFKDFLQTCSQKAEEVITALKSQNLEEMKTRVQGMYSDAINSPVQEKISEWSVDAKRSAGAHVDLVKRRILEAYDQMSLDNVTSALEKIIQYITDAYMSVYRETLSFIQELSKKVKPYVQVSEGKFKIDFPLPSGFP
ncbi:APOB protein, partial [Amia calva]|nr:APOB protein [Amia calva]